MFTAYLFPNRNGRVMVTLFDVSRILHMFGMWSKDAQKWFLTCNRLEIYHVRVRSNLRKMRFSSTFIWETGTDNHPLW